MRALRERPRLVAAKLALGLAALMVSALVAAAIAGDDSGSSFNLQPRLERSERLRRDQLGELQRQAAQITRLRADLRTTARRARDRARTNDRLRRDLRIARREEQQ
jgi:Spy/CpxP family protein refolding chaperone